MKVVPAKFYLKRPEAVARELLGKLLIRRHGGQTLIGRIVETEAYLGEDDPASHSFAGLTNRNSRAIWTAGSRLCLLHLWNALLPECLLRTRRTGGRCSVPRAGASFRACRDGEVAWAARWSFAAAADFRPGAALPGSRNRAGRDQWRRSDFAEIGSSDRRRWLSFPRK